MTILIESGKPPLSYTDDQSARANAIFNERFPPKYDKDGRRDYSEVTPHQSQLIDILRSIVEQDAINI